MSSQAPSEIPRFDVWYNTLDGAHARKRPDGEYVRYDDIKHLLQPSSHHRERAEEMLKKAIDDGAGESVVHVIGRNAILNALAAALCTQGGNPPELPKAPEGQIKDVAIRLDDAFRETALCHCGGSAYHSAHEGHNPAWNPCDDSRLLIDAYYEIIRLRGKLGIPVHGRQAAEAAQSHRGGAK